MKISVGFSILMTIVYARQYISNKTNYSSVTSVSKVMAPRKNAIFDARLLYLLCPLYKYVYCTMYIVHIVQYLDGVSWPRVSRDQNLKSCLHRKTCTINSV